MKIPRENFAVTLAARTIPVVWIPGLRDEDQGDLLDGLWEPEAGACGTIFLRAELSDSNAFETFLHELVHAIADTAGFGLTEHKTQTLAVFLHQGLHGLVKVGAGC